MAEHRRWYRRTRIWVLIGFAVFVTSLRLVATPLAGHFTRQALDNIPGFIGSFSRVKLSFIHLSYEIDDLKLLQTDQPPTAPPYVYVGSATGRLVWSDLVRLQFGGAARVEHAKVTMVIPPESTPSESSPAAKKPAGKPPAAPPRPGEILSKLFPFRIDRVELVQDELLVIDKTEKGVPDKSRELWIHDIEATIENVGTRRNLTKGEPATFALRAKVQRSGDLHVFVTSDPLAEGVNFAGETSLRGLQLKDLSGFMVGKSDMKPVSGSLEVFASIKCENGQINALVRPVLKNLKLEAASKDIGNQAKTELGKAAVKLSSEPGRDITVAPLSLKGSITDPKAQLWPMVISVVRDSYLAGVTGLLEKIEPGAAKKGQQPTQGRRPQQGE